MFGGAIVAIVTPFKNGKVDEDTLRNLIEEQIAQGTDGITPCGTTGESPTLSHEEHDQVVAITIDAAKGRVPVIAGTGSNSTAETLRLTRHAYEAGAAGALVVCPYYNRPSQEGLYRHFKTVAQEVPIPIIIYNIPGRTGANMLPETMARLAELPNIAGVKEAAGSLQQISDIIRICGPGFDVLSGDDIFTLPLMVLGGKGVISVISNVAPRDMAGLVDAAASGEWAKAREFHYRMAPLIEALFIETNPVPVKTALALLGKIQEEVRLPLCAMAEKNREFLKKTMRDYGLLT
ncbi:MAG: 4-hydroxy-tetrahydrodipicolinate synthase [Syntrophaceae bacterium]|nr:4-hydroxy-tetrahydrodipicolinate synthase [Syntrophaceae bacterium]